LPRTAAASLRNAGIDAIHVGKAGLAAAEDVTILDLGRDQDRVVVTLDADFHAILASAQAISP